MVDFDMLLTGYTMESFDWNNYQKLTKFIVAPKSLFANTQVAVSYLMCFRVCFSRDSCLVVLRIWAFVVNCGM